MGTRIANIVINAEDPRLVADFWCQVMDWQVLEEEHGIVCIGPADGALPGIDVAPWGVAKMTPNRLHLDLRADGTTTEEELARLLALGARRVDVGQGPDASWEVLADPEGNEFCLLSGTVQQLQQSTQNG